MKKHKIIISIFVIFIAIFACKPKEMTDYVSVDGVWFSVQPPTITGVGDPDIWPAKDTTQVSFIKLSTETKDTMVNLLVRVLGHVRDYDRKFGVSVGTTSTAEANVDYKLLSEYITVPAGAVRAYVPIQINRTDKMKLEEYSLTINLVATDDFTVPFPKKIIPPLAQHGDKDSIYVDKHTILIGDILYTPRTWNEYNGGPFTYKKLELLTEIYGVTFADLDDPTVTNSTTNRALFIGITYYLEEQQALGNPIYEVDVFGNTVYHTDEDGEFILDEDGEKIPMLVKFGNL